MIICRHKMPSYNNMTARIMLFQVLLSTDLPTRSDYSPPSDTSMDIISRLFDFIDVYIIYTIFIITYIDLLYNQ